MAHHLLIALRLHGDGQGGARYHGTWQGAPEWPPAPARVFQALVAGAARGAILPERLVSALEWLEALPPPTIAAPRAKIGARVSLFVPNNDADTLEDPRDVGDIRTSKAVHPMLLEDEVPFLYAWTLPVDAAPACVLVEAADDIYQLGRGVDMAWAVGEVVDDQTLQRLIGEHRGTIHRPETNASGRTLLCPVSGSLASLVRRHGAPRLRSEGRGKGAKILFTNAPKSSFLGVTYEATRHRVVYELRDRDDDARMWSWPLGRVVKLVESVRDRAVDRLREGLQGEEISIDRAMVGRRADGSNASPPEHRVHVIPLPSIGHEHVDPAVRRVLLEVPSGAPLRRADVEWAFSGLETVDRETGVVGPFVLTRSEGDTMLRHYLGPARRWRSVTAVVLPENAKRRHIEPSRRTAEAKTGSERLAEEQRAAAAVQVAFTHAGVRVGVTNVHVRREPFDARGSRVEAFADGTRFAKERLWHVDVELDRAVEGPLVIGDGRFLGLGVLAPVPEPWRKVGDDVPRASERGPILRGTNSPGLFGFTVGADAKDNPAALALALRRAVMARAQAVLGRGRLGPFFSGHEEDGTKAVSEHSNHLAFQWDPSRRRLLIIAPHSLDRREPSWDERAAINVLKEALEGFVELRAGLAGRFAVNRCSISDDDPLLAPSQTWASLTPYLATRHKKHAMVADVLADDVIAECHRRGLPRPNVTVLEVHGVAGRGLEGRVLLRFAAAVAGPLVLGRTRYLAGGLFAPEVR